MSKKIDASLFRRGYKNNEWDFKYTEKNKEESSLFFYKNYQIKNYINKIMYSHGLVVTLFKIEHSVSELVVKIAFFDLNKTNKQKTSDLINNNLIVTFKNYYNVDNVNIKLKNLNKSFENKVIKSKIFKDEFKKLLSQLKFLRTNIKQIEVIKMAFIVITNKNSSKLLAKFIYHFLSNKQNKYKGNIFISMKNLFKVLINAKISKISGLSINISGRINGFPRAKSRHIKIGTLPLQSINSIIDYSKETVYTANGTLGIKVLICHKP